MNLQSPEPLQVTLEPNDSHQLATLCGPLDAHLKQIEKRLGITINNGGNDFQLIGESDVARAAAELLKQLYREVTGGAELTPEIVHLFRFHLQLHLSIYIFYFFLTYIHNS